MADEMDQQERQSLYFKPAEIILVELMKSTFYLDTTHNTQQTKSNVNQLHIIIEKKLNVVIIQWTLLLSYCDGVNCEPTLVFVLKNSIRTSRKKMRFQFNINNFEMPRYS